MRFSVSLLIMLCCTRGFMLEKQAIIMPAFHNASVIDNGLNSSQTLILKEKKGYNISNL